MKTQQLVFAIQGMRQSSAACACALEEALKQTDGIITATANYATEQAMVVFDPLHVSTKEIIQIVHHQGLAVFLEHSVLDVDGLMYASSARTVARILECVEGVVSATVDLQAQQITLDVIAEHKTQSVYERELATLGLHVVNLPVPHRAREFVARLFIILVLTVIGFFSTSAHAGLLQARFLHAPLVVIGIAMVMVYVIAWQFYRVAFETALVRGRCDASVILAFIASASLFCGLPMALILPPSLLTTSGFMLAIGLTAGWFIVRGVTLWVASRNIPGTLGRP